VGDPHAHAVVTAPTKATNTNARIPL